MINIAKLLKDAPKDMKLYSPLFGEVKFKYTDNCKFGITVEDSEGCHRSFDIYGRYFTVYKNAECLLFPGEDCRTWEGWKVPVEPKFKVGDWIVRGKGFVYEPSLITEIRDYYICELLNGERVTYTLNDVHKNFHLWTIDDAKAGDVLVSRINNPFIYNGNIEFSSVGAYVGISQNGEIILDRFPSKCWTNVMGIKPATKEQHDLLFAKIREAGCEWDADKKELHKVIEPKFKVGDDIKTGGIIDTIAEIGYATQSYYCESGRTISFENQDLWHIAPKFKVGDWVVFNDNHNSIYQISEIKNFLYMLTHVHGGKMSLSFSQRNLLRPWTIDDAEEGDVLLDEGTNTLGIFEKILVAHWHSKIYCGNSDYPVVYETGGAHEIKDAKPATKEQCDLFFSKIKEAGYKWDENKKEIRKIKPHYDITNFEPFDKVLIRDSDGDRWEIEFFSGIQDYKCKFVCLCDNYRQCIPFNNDTKHLLGTTDMCPEEFINW